MRIILSPSLRKAANTVAEFFNDQIKSHPSSVIGLATGNTMIPVYNSWAEISKKHEIDHSKAFFFLLDEYLGIPENELFSDMKEES